MYKRILILFLANFFTVGHFQRAFNYYNLAQKILHDENFTPTIFPIEPTTAQDPVMETTEISIPNADIQCPANKSLHTEEDIRVLIDYVYEKLLTDETLKIEYEYEITNMRDIFMQELKQFIEWFNNRPEHLKHVLEGLARVRKQYIEPKIKRIAKTFDSYPELETKFKDKTLKFHKLKQSLKRYKNFCNFNCENNEEHDVFKREVTSNRYYCSSLAELYEKIEQRLNETTVSMKSNLTRQLSIDNEKYKQRIDKIQNNLKEKALTAFGRTMYEVLILQDEYYHYAHELNATAIETKIYSIKTRDVQIHTKLLELQRNVEKYGEHCRSCGDIFISAVRMYNVNLKDVIEDDSLTIVKSLIDSKFNEIEFNIANDWKQILNSLNEFILKTEEDSNLDHLKPIQEEVLKLIKAEREEMNNLKKLAPETVINNIVKLLQKSQDLSKEIDTTMHTVKILLKS